jgi:hypothetical protein
MTIPYRVHDSDNHLMKKLILIFTNKNFALKVTGKVTDSNTVFVFCLMYSQSQYYSHYVASNMAYG